MARRTLTLWIRVILALWIIATAALAAHAMLPMYTSGSNAPDRWDFNAYPVTFAINPSVNSNYSSGSGAAVTAIQNSFKTWSQAPNATISISQASDTSNTTAAFDHVNVICFICTGDYSKDSSTLAVTTTWTADAVGQDNGHGGAATFVGQILEADIQFNPNVEWVTNGKPNSSQQDLQTVATHEIGHFLGLDHSGIVRSVMYPYAASSQTTLSYDDVAGLSYLYPKSSPDFPTGSISGKVTYYPAASGVFGGHVWAESTSSSGSVSSSIRKSPISALTDASGNYVIRGVPADTYQVGVEPLDGPVQNSDIAGYSSYSGQSAVKTDFNTRWH